ENTAPTPRGYAARCDAPSATIARRRERAPARDAPDGPRKIRREARAAARKSSAPRPGQALRPPEDLTHFSQPFPSLIECSTADCHYAVRAQRPRTRPLAERGRRRILSAARLLRQPKAVFRRGARTRATRQRALLRRRA